MSFLVYSQRSTLLHRLHPGAKAVWLLCTGLILSVYFDPLPLAGLFLINLPFFFLGKVPWRRWAKMLLVVFFLGAFGYFIVSLWLDRPDVFSRYPEIQGITLLRIAGEGSLLGKMSVTVGGLMYVLGQSLRSLTMVLTVAVFVYSTRPNDLVYLLGKAKLPSKLVFVVMVAYRFFPHIFHKLSIVTAAQRLRGWELSLRNPSQLAHQFLPIAIPLLTETVRLSDYTTWAVESRAYGSGRFVLHHDLPLKPVDWLFGALWVGVLGVALALYWIFGIGPL